MATPNAPPTARKSLIGSPSNFWLHHTTYGFNLTHPFTPTTPVSTPTLTIQTTTTPIMIDPSKSALVIVDMQNFFLSPSLGRIPSGPGHIASDNLINHAIPAARKAGIRIIWLNWGLTGEDLRTMPPAVRRCFGFYAIPEDSAFPPDFDASAGSVGVDRFGVPRDGHGREAMYHGLGAPCGTVTLDSGEAIDAGDLLVRDAWNADIYPPLKALYDPASDAWIHKNRMSGLWGSNTPLQKYLEEEGLRTLLFAGVNTDQCVGGTLTDAFSNGYDCVLLSDGCGTSSGEGAQKAWEFNAERTFGFCVKCEGLAEGVGRM
ncbi:isochorismatase family protein [Karstenula rhodostoma CBS 690.94]|uniref:Isochorismatase family protein n=1 Tax=Karstenula rhodostoma CBS 690.94 TaxID=1392251 RepID=A0A9P4PRJ9_9PLEO|nr:isochorismatase family protein [Karstenula rhodostoma CBS 690.94]